MPPAVPAFLQPLVTFTPCFQIRAVREALARSDESVPHLIAALDWATDHAKEALDSDFMLHTYALHILGELREPTALPAVLRLVQSPAADSLVGDDLTSAAPGILAALAGRSLRQIEPLITNRGADEYARGAGIRALGVATMEGALTHDDLLIHIERLIAALHGNGPGHFWDALAALIVDFRIPSLLPAVRHFFRDGLCDPMFCPLDVIEREIFKPFDPESDHIRRDYQPYPGTIASMQGWYCFQPDSEDARLWKSPQETGFLATLPPDSFDLSAPAFGDVDAGLGEAPAPLSPPTGRNEPCPCGSGKKFKKCCGAPGEAVATGTSHRSL